MISEKELEDEIERLYAVISELERNHAKKVESLQDKIKELLSEVRR